MVIIVSTNLPANDAGWKTYLQNKQQIASIGLYDFCVAVHEFKQSCSKTQGGSDFTQRAMKWLDLAKPTVHELAKIGGDPKLSALADSSKLPNGKKAMLEITKLSDDEVADGVESGAINPESTAKQVKDIKTPEAETDERPWYEKDYSDKEGDVSPTTEKSSPADSNKSLVASASSPVAILTTSLTTAIGVNTVLTVPLIMFVKNPIFFNLKFYIIFF